MRGVLTDLSILSVEDDLDSAEMLTIALERFGGTVRHAATADEALAVLGGWRPDVVLSDLALPGLDGHGLLAAIRARAELASLPAIAMSGRNHLTEREKTIASGFAKYLSKPASIMDIAAAIVAVCPGRAVPSRLDRFRAVATQVAELTPCRFTSVLRFVEEGTLHSVWTIDKERPGVDPFPLQLPIEASYCVLVRAAAGPIAIENAMADVRVIYHPKRTSLASYLAAPIVDESGRLFGTLCTYDPAPRSFSVELRSRIEAAAGELASAAQGWPRREAR